MDYLRLTLLPGSILTFGKTGREMLTHNTLGKNGRLGNQMFQYASTKGVALNGGHDYQIPLHGHSLFQAFELPGIESHTNPVQGLQTFNERFYHFDKDFFISISSIEFPPFQKTVIVYGKLKTNPCVFPIDNGKHL